LPALRAKKFISKVGRLSAVFDYGILVKIIPISKGGRCFAFPAYGLSEVLTISFATVLNCSDKDYAFLDFYPENDTPISDSEVFLALFHD
jgi:hypothetical protein